MEVLTYPGLKPIDWMHPPATTDRVATDLIAGDGVRFTGSFRTVCHWMWMDAAAVKRYDTHLHMSQPPYNTTNESSKGTHDLDACKDWRIDGVAWLEVQRFGRAHGDGCWWRHTGPWSDPLDYHVHGFTLPHNRTFATPVGIYVDGGASTGHPGNSSQLDDYYRHALGLAGMHNSGADHTWFPPDIDATIFNLNAFVTAQQEELMEYNDWSQASKNQLAKDVAAAVQDSVLGADMNALEPSGSPLFKGVTLRDAVKSIYKAVVPKPGK